MSPPNNPAAITPEAQPTEAVRSRRGFLEAATYFLGGLITLLLAVPGIAYLTDPLRRRRGGNNGANGDAALRALPVTFDELEVGVPRQFPVVDERRDAWVKYPPEPIGAIWLVRQPKGTEPKVLAFSAECPHLGCAVNLSADRHSFVCPCHASAFALDGARSNRIPPRALDRLAVEPIQDEKAPIRVRFERFRTGIEEKIPLA
jgi:menaquinol-cytochrome c reductase iron-sulfur subunit